MADTPQLKVIKELTEAQKLTNENLLKINESIKAQMSGVRDAIKEPPKKDIEEIKEKKTENKKFLDSLKGIFKVAGAGGGESLMGGIKKMMSKYKKIIMTLLGVGLVGFLSMLDMKQLGQLWKSFKEVLVAIKDFLVPIIKGIWEWTKSTLIPETFNFFLRQLDNIKELFAGLSETFSGWTEKTPMEKFTSILDAFTKIGVFMGETALNIITWGGKLLGVDGDLGKSIKAQWEKWFGGKDEGEGGSNFLSKIGSVLGALVGMFAIGTILPGWMGGKLLTAPLKIAIKLLSSSVGGAISGIKGISGMMGGGIVGAVGTAGILFLTAAVANGMKDAYAEYKAGGSGTKIWEAGLNGFFKVLTLGLMDETITKAFAKDTVSMFTSFRDAMFPSEAKKKKMKEDAEKTMRGKEAYSKSRSGFFDKETVEEKMAGMEREELRDMVEFLRKATFGGLESKAYKQAVKGYDAKIAEEGKQKKLNEAQNERWRRMRAGEDIDVSTGAPMPIPPTPTVTTKIPGLPDTKMIKPLDLSQLQTDEGFRKGVYKDTMGIKTVGYGFNLERAGSQEALDAAGIKKSLAGLKGGKLQLTKEEADRLMRGEYPHFADAAKRFVGKETWNQLTLNRQKILTNMAYNMGEDGLKKFENLRTALQAGDYQTASTEMLDSDWSGQVKGRADRLAARMKDNTSGVQLAAAQTEGGNLQARLGGGGGNVTINKGGDNTTTESYHVAQNVTDTAIHGDARVTTKT